MAYLRCFPNWEWRNRTVLKRKGILGGFKTRHYSMCMLLNDQVDTERLMLSERKKMVEGIQTFRRWERMRSRTQEEGPALHVS